MNLQNLQGLYQDDSRVKDISAAISVPSPLININLKNLRGSAINFIATAVWNHASVNHVFVLNDKEEAAYFHNDLERLTNALDIFYFPDSFKRVGFYDALNSSHLMLRTEALTKFNGTDIHKKVIVTYPEALFEKVVEQKSLSKNVIHIKTNETIDVNAILTRLVTLGFKKEDFVYEPGQFAVRGGIFDIYSYGNEHPYRIELFGNEVDSIRIFNPETQLSERKLLQVSILPNIETSFDVKDKISLLEYLPQNTTFWFKDFKFTTEKIAHLEEKLTNNLAENEVVGSLESNNEEDAQQVMLTKADFETFADWKRNILQRHLISFGKEACKKDALVVAFDTEPQPSFNRNFELLKSNIQKWAALKYTPYIFAENAKQLERLRAIFEDINAQISFVPVPVSVSKGYIDHDLKALIYTDHQIFERFHKYNIKQAYTKGKAITIKSLRELQPGDFVSHIDHGVGKYSGLQKIEVNGLTQEAVRIIYRDNDVLYVNVNSLHKISKYTGKDGTVPKIHKLGSDAWEKLKNKTKKQVKDIATDLIRLYALRKASEGFAFTTDNYMQAELEASFFYEDTPDQTKATADVKKDMEAIAPMDRLVCGDVGFGKTEIAVRAAFKAVCDSKQVAIMVPTTILAFQHYQSFVERLKDFPVNVDYINRFKSAKQKKETFKNVEEGKVDILIGTHAILSKDLKFKDLGLFIIDEEQKFGVAAKEKLRERKANIDTLTLTATPIPRTLQFSLMSARDLSIINTPPPNRQPVHTELIGFNEEIIRDAIYYESERGGQVYFIHNRVQSLPGMAEKLKALCPDLEIAVAHGQMEGSKLEKTLMDFINHKYDVICCTNIVESGVDISNANTIIINNAHHFGLSDLHQLRGRVGRSNKKAFCYLVAPSLMTLPDDSRKRLQILEEFNELGSGFQIAMRDLDIRGAGNILGGEQSGFVADIGFEMYQKILAEAIQELKESDFKDLFKEELAKKRDFVSDCTIDTDLEILIPEEYVQSITERLSLYTQLDHLETELELRDFEHQLIDRFGPIPAQVYQLFATIRSRKMAKSLGFEKMFIKGGKMKLYFISNPESPYFESETFNGIMDYIQKGAKNVQMKQIGTVFMLVVTNIKSMDDVQFFLEGAMPILEKINT